MFAKQKFGKLSLPRFSLGKIIVDASPLQITTPTQGALV